MKAPKPYWRNTRRQPSKALGSKLLERRMREERERFQRLSELPPKQQEFLKGKSLYFQFGFLAGLDGLGEMSNPYRYPPATNQQFLDWEEGRVAGLEKK